MMCRCFANFLIVTCAGASAQWAVPTKVVLDGSAPADQQITGLAAPTGETHGTNASTDRLATTNYAAVTGINALSIALSPAPGSLTPGMRLTLTPEAVNTGDASLDVNGLGPVPVRKHVNLPLDSADLRPGIPVQLVYDGAVFQVASQLYPGCPAGYKPVGQRVCIADSSFGPISWYAAVNACTEQGMRLCGFSEWIQACLQSNSIFPTIADYEWVDEAANSTNDAKSMGVNEVTLLPDCRAGSTRAPLTNLRYRCCFDR